MKPFTNIIWANRSATPKRKLAFETRKKREIAGGCLVLWDAWKTICSYILEKLYNNNNTARETNWNKIYSIILISTGQSQPRHAPTRYWQPWPLRRVPAGQFPATSPKHPMAVSAPPAGSGSWAPKNDSGWHEGMEASPAAASSHNMKTWKAPTCYWVTKRRSCGYRYLTCGLQNVLDARPFQSLMLSIRFGVVPGESTRPSQKRCDPSAWPTRAKETQACMPKSIFNLQSRKRTGMYRCILNNAGSTLQAVKKIGTYHICKGLSRMKLKQARANGRSKYDCLEIAKCLVI